MYMQGQQVGYAPAVVYPGNYPGQQINAQFVQQPMYQLPPQPNKGLTWINWCNILAFAVTLIVSFEWQSHQFGASSEELTAKYQTLVTPASWSCAWISWLIALYNAVFVVCQALPKFRDHPVTLAVSPWWWATCAFESLFVIAFAQEYIPLSFLLMLGYLVSLMGAIVAGDLKCFPGAIEGWLLRAPFAVHGGWIIFCSLLMLNVVFDSNHAPPETLLAAAVMSFVVACFMNTFFALVFKGPDQGILICLVSSWAFAGIASELELHMHLDDPSRFNPHTWTPEVTGGIHNAAQAFSFFAFCLAIVAAFMFIRKRGN